MIEYRDLLFAIELTQDAVEDLTVNLSRAIRPSDKVEKKLTKQKVKQRLDQRYDYHVITDE